MIKCATNVSGIVIGQMTMAATQMSVRATVPFTARPASRSAAVRRVVVCTAQQDDAAVSGRR